MSGVLDIKDLEAMRKIGGSRNTVYLMHTKDGTQYYVKVPKQTKTESANQRAMNEYFMTSLARLFLADVVPQMYLVRMENGEIRLASKDVGVVDSYYSLYMHIVGDYSSSIKDARGEFRFYQDRFRSFVREHPEMYFVEAVLKLLGEHDANPCNIIFDLDDDRFYRIDFESCKLVIDRQQRFPSRLIKMYLDHRNHSFHPYSKRFFLSHEFIEAINRIALPKFENILNIIQAMHDIFPQCFEEFAKSFLLESEKQIPSDPNELAHKIYKLLQDQLNELQTFGKMVEIVLALDIGNIEDARAIINSYGFANGKLKLPYPITTMFQLKLRSSSVKVVEVPTKSIEYKRGSFEEHMERYKLHPKGTTEYYVQAGERRFTKNPEFYSKLLGLRLYYIDSECLAKIVAAKFFFNEVLRYVLPNFVPKSRLLRPYPGTESPASLCFRDLTSSTTQLEITQVTEAKFRNPILVSLLISLYVGLLPCDLSKLRIGPDGRLSRSLGEIFMPTKSIAEMFLDCLNGSFSNFSEIFDLDLNYKDLQPFISPYLIAKLIDVIALSIGKDGLSEFLSDYFSMESSEDALGILTKFYSQRTNEFDHFIQALQIQRLVNQRDLDGLRTLSTKLGSDKVTTSKFPTFQICEGRWTIASHRTITEYTEETQVCLV